MYQNMPGKTSLERPGTALERKFSTFENYQTRVAAEGTQIVNEKLREKITELDELCMSGSFNISRLDEIREYTSTSVTAYLAECKRLQKKAEKNQGGGNPFLQLLAGGMGGGGGAGAEAEEGEEMYEPEEEEESTDIALPQKLLLSKMSMDENNKINFKLSLELETPETKKKEQEKKKREAEKREIEEKQTEEEPEAKKPKRNTRSARKNKKQQKEEEEQEEEEKLAEEEAEKAKKKKVEEPSESSMSVTEASSTKKEEDEEEEEVEPVLQSHPEIFKLSTQLRRHIDVILDWVTTIRQWIQSNMSRNKNIGGADINNEIRQQMLEELGGAEQEFHAHKEMMAAYYIARASILEKYVKCPEFEDYLNFLVDEDEKQFILLRTIVIAMRNNTVNLFDNLTKDQDTLFTAAGSSKQNDYAAFSMY